MPLSVAAGVGYGLKMLITNKFMHINGNDMFNDYFDMTNLDTGKLLSLIIALPAAFTTFLPGIANGLSRAIIKWIGKQIGNLGNN